MKAYPMSKPQPNTIFETASAVHSAVSAMPRDEAEHTQAHQLSPAARAVTEQPHEPAYSPIVLAGLGPPDRDGFGRRRRFCGLRRVCRAELRLRLVLLRRHFRHCALGDAGLPGRRHLSGAGLPRAREAVHAARLRLVGGVSDRHQCFVLRQGRRPILARVARRVLCARPVRADRFPARAVPSGPALDQGGPARPPHGGGRLRQ